MKTPIIIAVIIILIVGGYLLYRSFSGSDNEELINATNNDLNITVANANTRFGTEEECTVMENIIQGHLAAANYCQQDSDCVMLAKYWCPFGCYNLLNKEVDTGQIDKEVQQYDEACLRCVYDCMTPPEMADIKCIKEKCVDIRFNN
ncbi:MAG: hypothetical protein V1838_01175 [Patescibacteria group bacterium]